MNGYPAAIAVRTGDAWLIETAPGTGVARHFAASSLSVAKAATVEKFATVYGRSFGARWVSTEPGLAVLTFPSRPGAVSAERVVWEYRAPLTLHLDRSVSARRMWAALKTQLETGLDNQEANDQLADVYAAQHLRRAAA